MSVLNTFSALKKKSTLALAFSTSASCLLPESQTILSPDALVPEPQGAQTSLRSPSS